jgi:Immunoglobulin I-set domain
VLPISVATRNFLFIFLFSYIFSFFCRIIFENIQKTDAGWYACHSVKLRQWYNITLQVQIADLTCFQDFGEAIETQILKTNADELDGNEVDDSCEADRLKLTNQNGRANRSRRSKKDLFPYFMEPDQLRKVIRKRWQDTVTLRCDATGKPEPNITWTINGKEVARSLRYTHEKYTFVIDDLTADDAGAYNCKVCNSMGCINHATEITIYGEFYHIFDNCCKFSINTAKNRSQKQLLHQTRLSQKFHHQR